MEAVIFLSSITFIIAVGSAVVQGITFWKRYRVRLHVTTKEASGAPSMELEELESGHSIIQQPLQRPQLVHHSRLGSRSSRWAYPDRRYRPISDYQFGSYRIAEEPESGTVAHHVPHPAPTLPATFLPQPATAPATIVQPEATTPHD
ncbi:unnamed protein product [Penicillium bialowiezense]